MLSDCNSSQKNETKTEQKVLLTKNAKPQNQICGTLESMEGTKKKRQKHTYALSEAGILAKQKKS
jgi:hypothetical protein